MTPSAMKILICFSSLLVCVWAEYVCHYHVPGTPLPHESPKPGPFPPLPDFVIPLCSKGLCPNQPKIVLPPSGHGPGIWVLPPGLPGDEWPDQNLLPGTIFIEVTGWPSGIPSPGIPIPGLPADQWPIPLPPGISTIPGLPADQWPIPLPPGISTFPGSPGGQWPNPLPPGTTFPGSPGGQWPNPVPPGTTFPGTPGGQWPNPPPPGTIIAELPGGEWKILPPGTKLPAGPWPKKTEIFAELPEGQWIKLPPGTIILVVGPMPPPHPCIGAHCQGQPGESKGIPGLPGGLWLDTLPPGTLIAKLPGGEWKILPPGTKLPEGPWPKKIEIFAELPGGQWIKLPPGTIILVVGPMPPPHPCIGAHCQGEPVESTGIFGFIRNIFNGIFSGITDFILGLIQKVIRWIISTILNLLASILPKRLFYGLLPHELYPLLIRPPDGRPTVPPNVATTPRPIEIPAVRITTRRPIPPTMPPLPFPTLPRPTMPIPTQPHTLSPTFPPPTQPTRRPPVIPDSDESEEEEEEEDDGGIGE